MLEQCPQHGCSEMLCGCPSNVLINKSPYWEELRAKNKVMSRLLEDQETLISIIEQYMKGEYVNAFEVEGTILEIKSFHERN